MDNLNRASKHFAELSEVSIKFATADMFKNGGKKQALPASNYKPRQDQAGLLLLLSA